MQKKRAQTGSRTAKEAVLHRAASVKELQRSLQHLSSISSVKSETRHKYQVTHDRRTAHDEAEQIAPAAQRATNVPLVAVPPKKKKGKKTTVDILDTGYCTRSYNGGELWMLTPQPFLKYPVGKWGTDGDGISDDETASAMTTEVR